MVSCAGSILWMESVVSQYDCDLFVIGAGSGGVRAARMTATHGRRVMIAERDAFGGTCVNLGCIPKKLFSYAAHYHDDLRDAPSYGWEVNGLSFDWPTLRDNKNREIERLNGIYQRLLEQAGVQVVRGHARLVDPHTVAVGDQHYRAREILLATGGVPWVPEIPGREHMLVSDDVFHLPVLPRRLLVVGGGYIALELASIFNGLGCATEIAYRGELFLRGFDVELREQLAVEMAARGLVLSFNTEVREVVRTSAGELSVTLNTGERRTVDAVLAATGRSPNIADLGLDRVPLALTDKGHLQVDAEFRTSEPSILAVGDMIGGPELTPVALAEGMAVADRIGTGNCYSVDYENIPTAIFSLPNVATVGLSEEEALKRYGEVAIYSSRFTSLRHSLTGKPEKTFMKLVVEPVSDRVLGAHMLGAEAGEIIQGLAVALKAGATKRIFDQTIGIHPTAAEEFVTMRQRTR